MRTCVIRAASHLSDGTYDYICREAKKKFGEDLTFRRVTDDTLLGGFILELGSEIYDLSFASQLAAIKAQIGG